jgi:hypothetical protein
VAAGLDSQFEIMIFELERLGLAVVPPICWVN